jgi:hypothetical protein
MEALALVGWAAPDAVVGDGTFAIRGRNGQSSRKTAFGSALRLEKTNYEQ